MKKILFLIVLTVFVAGVSNAVTATDMFSGSPNPAAAEPDVADVPGEAAIVNGDIAAAREMALGDARRKAIEQVLGTYVDARVMLQNELLTMDSTFIKIAGAATIQNVYSESQDADGFYRLRALVKVFPNTLQQSLDKLAASAVVDVKETVLAKPGKGEISAYLRSELSKGGFKVIDPDWLSGQGKTLAKVKSGDMNAARTLGTRYMADVIIVGEVEVSFRRNMEGSDIPYVDPSLLKGMVACQARADIRALDPQTGKIICSYTGSGRELVGLGPTQAAAADESLRNTEESAARYLLENLPKPSSETPSIEVTVRGIASFKEATDISGTLSRIRGVEGVKMGSFNAANAIYSVSYREGEEMLARELAGLSGPSLSVISVDKGKISVRAER